MSNMTDLENHNNLLIDIDNTLTDIKTEISNLPDYIDTTDATAVSKEIARGKTAYVNGEKITGILNPIPSTEGATFKADYILSANDDRYENLSLRKNTDWDTYPYYTTETSNLGLFISKETLANEIGLTSEKIVKGNTILRVKGTAQITSNETENFFRIPILYFKADYIENDYTTVCVPNLPADESIPTLSNINILIKENEYIKLYNSYSRLDKIYNIDTNEVIISNKVVGNYIVEYTLRNNNGENAYIEFPRNLTSKYIEDIKDYTWVKTSEIPSATGSEEYIFNLSTHKLGTYQTFDNASEDFTLFKDIILSSASNVSEKYNIIDSVGDIIEGTLREYSADTFKTVSKIELDENNDVKAKVASQGIYRRDSGLLLNKTKLASAINLTSDKIKSGESILGIEGAVEALSSLGVKVFDTKELMEADTEAVENDIAMVFDKENKQFKGMYQYNLNYIDENLINSITDENLTIFKDESDNYRCTYNKDIEVPVKYDKNMIIKAVAYFIKNFKTLEGLQDDDVVIYDKYIIIGLINNNPYIFFNKRVREQTGWKTEEDGNEVEYTYNEYTLGQVNSIITLDLKLDTEHLYSQYPDIVSYKINSDGTLSDRNIYTTDSNSIITLENITSYNLAVSVSNLEELRIFFNIFYTKINSETGTIIYDYSINIISAIMNISNIDSYINKGYKCLYLPSNEIINMSTLSSDEVLESRLFINENGSLASGTLIEYENEEVLTANAALTYIPNRTDFTIGATIENSGIIRQNNHLYISIKQSALADNIGLTASKIMSGNTILRVKGTATADADATAADIAIGKTAYVKGKKITGTLESTPLNTDGIILQEFDDCPITITLEGSTSTVELKINTTKDTGTIANTPIGVIVNYSTLADAIGLTADKLKTGETVLGITGI